MRKMHSKEELEALASGGGGISYSTEEQDTGLTWIDGKKIYQKTFSKTNIAGTESNTTLAELSDEPDSLISIEAVMIIDSSGFAMNGSYLDYNGVKIYLDVALDGAELHAYTTSRTGVTKDIYVTLRYTKIE